MKRWFKSTAKWVICYRHLLNTYFQSVHLQFPVNISSRSRTPSFSKSVPDQVIDVMSFREKFNAANQRPEDMGPVGEVLCAAMAAWGARYSGNPVVLGLAGYESQSIYGDLGSIGRL